MKKHKSLSVIVWLCAVAWVCFLVCRIVLPLVMGMMVDVRRMIVAVRLSRREGDQRPRRPAYGNAPGEVAGTVKVNQANVRSGPGTGYPVVATIERDTQLRLVAADESGDWYNVTWSNGERGWIWRENVETGGDVSNVRVAATIPALPTSASVNVPASQPAAATNPPTERPPVCDCSGDNYSCGNFSSQWAAQACFNYCLPISGDIHRLDGDNDGRVCE